ncbi:efflux RND transporter periplasmic adaptor subunit [Hymenobacter terricola]|uniref:efflux RND transporter periplasmic adaptor subunit n=1 Tax=Hymenobacter terricola TaxID=2819236 RepID=UPI001B308444|nr:efflux RND transporter periplasmic adaptor subunit [Hymenobacter terricola]
MFSNKSPFLFLALSVSLAACGHHDDPKTASAVQAEATATPATAALGSYYTCSMHPQVHQDHPSDCPICGMALIKVNKAAANGRTLQLSAEQVRLGNIRVATVGEARADGSTAGSASGLRLTGRVVLNPENLVQVSARVPGRVDRLYVRATGETVRAGAPLFAIYSEELLKAQQELLLAHAQRRELTGGGIDYAPLVEAARTKLRLWGMTTSQIAGLLRSGKVLNPMPYFSPRSGVVQELSIREGDYVSEGTAVVQLADLSSVWVEAQLYATDQPLRDGQPVQVSFPAFPGQTVTGRVSFSSPELAAESKVALVRVQIPNPRQQYTPGLQAVVETTGPAARPQSTASSGLRVPVEAVLQESAGNSLWVRTPDGRFENRMVTLGPQTGEQVEILSNLKAGEQVVVNGVYLLNSEYILQKGATPMAGMEGMKM